MKSTPMNDGEVVRSVEMQFPIKTFFCFLVSKIFSTVILSCGVCVVAMERIANVTSKQSQNRVVNYDICIFINYIRLNAPNLKL